MDTPGRLTLPIEAGMDDAVRELITRLGADAVRDSDGTHLPDVVSELATTVYGKYFVGRGDNAWANTHPEELTRIFLQSERVLAASDGPLEIDVLRGWFREQVAPDLTVDRTRYWQVIDRTTGTTLDPSVWRIVPGSDTGDAPEPAAEAAAAAGPDVAARPTTVVIDDATAGHVYTVGYLAVQLWDPTQMYNYLTNNWAEDPTREKEKPFDVRHPATWEHVKESLAAWLQANPHVDVVRFTTFFYHFTLVYGEDAAERFVDWFGYSASVSVAALEAFAAEYGYALTPEDFIDEGYYNSPFRSPSPRFRDWIAFQHRFVTGRVAELVEAVHADGREAIMFLGDNWIGVEPYGPHFERTGLDAVVGSVGSGATCRMISDIPHVSYTEGRFLPYFFPDVFREGGDPVGEANASWLPARRAIVRSPLDRIGYGGYLSLAVQHPEFVDRVEEIITEFRGIHDVSQGQPAQAEPLTVGLLNAWGHLRTWQAHMVAHAVYYRQTYTYLGVQEALAGLPLQVRFLSFDDVRDGVSDDIDVLINAGAVGTAFSGGAAWEDPSLVAAVNAFITRGGGLIGVGEPSAHPGRGTTFRLADALGVDQEIGWGLSTNRRPVEPEPHFITADLTEPFDDGEGTADIVLTSPHAQTLLGDERGVRGAAHAFGAGRAVYLSGLPYSSANSRLLHRAIHWAAGREDDFGPWTAADPRVEVAHYPHAHRAFAFNNSLESVSTTVRGDAGASWPLTLGPGASAWLDTASSPHTM